MNAIHSMIDRLGRLLRNRFGVALAYQRLDSGQAALREKLLRDSPLRVENEWLFPVFSGYQLVGCAKVSGADRVLEDICPQLAEFVEVYLNAAVHLKDHLETLDLIEAQLSLSELQKNGDNVIPFQRPQAAPSVSRPRLRRRLRLGFAMPCLLEGLSYDDLKKLALELHELSGRYVFVYLADLKWKTSADLKSLGPASIYIPELSALDFERQEALIEYLRRRPSIDDAQIIACSVLSYSELRQSGRVLPELLQHLSACYLRMDRPFLEYRRESIVELFFGSLFRDQQKDHLI